MLISNVLEVNSELNAFHFSTRMEVDGADAHVRGQTEGSGGRSGEEEQDSVGREGSAAGGGRAGAESPRRERAAREEGEVAAKSSDAHVKFQIPILSARTPHTCEFSILC